LPRQAGGAPFHEDLRALVAGCGAEALEVQRVSRLAAPRHRGAAYRIRLADGRLLKGRELRDGATAERVAYVLRCAPHPAFPRLLAQRGVALLLEWIDGHLLAPDASGEGVVREAADFLAALHTTRVPAERPGPHGSDAPRAAVSRQTARSARHLEQLAQARVLDEGRSSAVGHLLEVLCPARFDVGFVHGDLCAENLVIDGGGRVRVVDNEAVDLGACDGDLARSLYRWPLSRCGAAALLDAYARRRSVDSFLAHFGYWALAARLGSAAHRIGASPAVSGIPLWGLEQLLAAIERGAIGEELLNQSLT
jgi:aminoglycoside phosphotransferase (APT) family kinase protein